MLIGRVAKVAKQVFKQACNRMIKEGGGLAPAYFPPTNFVEDAFEKDESYSFLKILFRGVLFEGKNFGEKLSARLSKLHSACPEEYFEENIFFEKN